MGVGDRLTRSAIGHYVDSSKHTGQDAHMIPRALLGVPQVPTYSLIISLAFGLGQCGIGALMVVRGARQGRWQAFKSVLLVVLGASLALSGVVELIVSGAEGLSALSGVPDASQFRQVRLIADDALGGGLALAGLTLALFPLWRRFVPVRQPSTGPLEEPS